MTSPVRFGVVGGYGATGRAAVAELAKSGDGEILVGGRDLAKAQVLAAEFGGRVTAAHLDVLDAASLDDFCRRCSIVVNCGGPVMLLRDRVAQAAWRRRCHYVDAAGLTCVREGMLAHSREIADAGLSFVISAGWLPGLTELLPVYAHVQARKQMEVIESLEVYFGDSGEWSDGAYRDMAWYLRHTGVPRPVCFRKGEQTRVPMRHASSRVDLGGRVGLRRFSLVAMPESEDAARRLNDCDVFFHSYLPSPRAAMAAVVVALLPLPQKFAVRLLGRALRSVPLPVGGFVVARVLGRSQGSKRVFTAQIVYDPGREYWINGLALATAARMVAEGRVQSGVHFLASAVDPAAFVADLRKAGVEVNEECEPLES